jgi:hypothetical protein
MAVGVYPRLWRPRLACWEGDDMGSVAGGLREAVLAEALRLAEASDLLESTVAEEALPPEVLTQLLEGLRPLADAAEAALALAERECLRPTKARGCGQGWPKPKGEV